MISRATVLVLGAGASVDYGFPVARQLLMRIVNGCQPNGPLSRFFAEHREADQRECARFAQELNDSGYQSVDFFLQSRAEYVTLGKSVIAAALIPCECDGNLDRRETAHWYEHLFDLLRATPEAFPDNKLSIISFNYDRSLEQYLFRTLKSAFGLSGAEAVTLVRSVEIIHPYGTLGGQLYFEQARPYEPTLSLERVGEAAQSLRIMFEGEAAEAFAKARRRLEAAEEIIFLGFGFHDSNVMRLGFHEMEQQTLRQKRWFASRTGIPDGDLARITRRMHLARTVTIRFGDRGDDALAFLRNTKCLLG